MSEMASINKTAGGYREISLDLIRANPDQPRKHFDEAALEELACSMREVGLIQPITVRRVDDVYVIVAGERRWRAAHRAGLPTITVKVATDIGDDRAEFIRSVTENVNRRDMTAMEEANAYARLRDEFDTTVDGIAEVFGKSRSHVEMRLSLLNLTPEAKQAAETGVLQPNLARYVARLQPSNQRLVLRRQARGDFRNEIEAATFCRALHEQEKVVQDDFGLEQQSWAPAPPKQNQRSSAPRKVFDAVDVITKATDPALLDGLNDEDFSTIQAAVEALMKAARQAEKNARKAAAMRDAALAV